MAENQQSRQQQLDQLIDTIFPPAQGGTPSAVGQNQSYAADLATSVGTGLRQLPGAVAGLADIAAAPFANRPFSRGAAALGDAIGFRPSEGIAQNYQELTPETQSALQAVEEAKGFGGTLGAYMRNPRAIGTSVAEAIPGTVAGGGVGGVAGGVARSALARGSTSALARGLSRPAVAAGVGEGSIAAGFQMAGTDEEVDPLRAAAGSLAAGVGVGLIAGVGGAAAQRLGIGDPEMIFQGGRAMLPKGVKPRRLMTRIMGGAVSEGVFQEMPQGAFEQLTQNWAEQRPLLDGVDKAAVQSMVAGMGMGAVAGPLGSPRPYEDVTDLTGGEGGTQTTPGKTERFKGLDIQSLEDKQLVEGIANINEMFQGATPEQKEVLTEALKQGQAEVRRRGLRPTIVDELTTLVNYKKARNRRKFLRDNLDKVRAQSVDMAAKYESEIRQKTSEIEQMLAVYPDLNLRANEDQLADAKETVKRIKKKKNRTKEDRAEMREAKAVIKAAETGGQTEGDQTVTDQPVGATTKRDKFMDATKKQPKHLWRVTGEPATNQDGVAYVDIIANMTPEQKRSTLVELEGKVESLNKKREKKGQPTNTGDTLIEEQVEFLKQELEGVPEATPEQQAEAATRPLSVPDAAELFLLGEAEIDQKKRLTKVERDTVGLYMEAARFGDGRSPVQHVLLETYLQTGKMPNRKTVNDRLNRARSKMIEALARNRNISREEAVRLLPEDFLQAKEAEYMSVKSALEQLSDAELRSVINQHNAAKEEMQLRKAAIAAGIVDPQFGKNPQDDSNTAARDRQLQGKSYVADPATADIVAEEAALDPLNRLTDEEGAAYMAAREEAGVTLPEEGEAFDAGLGLRDRPNDQGAGASETNTLAMLRTLGGGLRLDKMFTKEQSRNILTMDKTRTKLENQLPDVAKEVDGMRQQVEIAAQTREVPLFERLGSIWNSMSLMKDVDKTFDWSKAGQEDNIVAEMRVLFSALRDPESRRQETVRGMHIYDADILYKRRLQLEQQYKEQGSFAERQAKFEERYDKLPGEVEQIATDLRNIVEYALNNPKQETDADINRRSQEAFDRMKAMAPAEGTLGSLFTEEQVQQLAQSVADKPDRPIGQTRVRRSAEDQAVREQLQAQILPQPLTVPLGRVTYADLPKDAPVPDGPSIKEAEKIRDVDDRMGPLMDAIRREKAWNRWVHRGNEAGFSTVGEDGHVYTLVRNGLGSWSLYTPASTTGKLAEGEALEEELYGDYKSQKEAQDVVARQSKHTEQELYREQLRQRNRYKNRPVRSQVTVNRRKIAAEVQAETFRRRKEENAANYRWAAKTFDSTTDRDAHNYEANVAAARKGAEVALNSDKHRLEYWQGQPESETQAANVEKYTRWVAESEERLAYWQQDNPDLDGQPSRPPRQSIGEIPVENPSTVTRVREALNRYIPAGNHKRVTIVQSHVELEQVLAREGIELDPNAAAFITKNNRVYFIADNIEQGFEAGVAMHEIGVHMNMSPMQIGLFANSIRDMARSGTKWARDALAQVNATRDAMESLGAGKVSQFDIDHEVVAYFVEYAVNAGVTPTNLDKQSGVVARFFRNLLMFIRTTAQALGFHTRDLSPRDIVDAAWGAADTVFRRPTSNAENRQSVARGQESGTRITQAWEQAEPVARKAWVNAGHYTRQVGQKFMFGHEFANWAARHLPSAPAYFETIARRVSARGEFDRRIQHAVDQAKRLNSKQRRDVNEYLILSQTEEAWGERPDWAGAVEPDKISETLRQEWVKLNSEQQQIIKNVFSLSSTLQTELRNTLRGEIEQAGLDLIDREADPAKKSELEDQLLQDLEKFDKDLGPQKVAWMPLRRHGEYAVVYMSNEMKAAMDSGQAAPDEIRAFKQDDAHYRVEFVETPGLADQRGNELMAEEGRGDGVIRVFQRQQQLSAPEMVPFNFMNSIRAQTEASVDFDEYGNPRNATANAQMKAWNRMYIEQLAETSIRKSELTRDHVAGFDRDMLRGFIDYGTGIGGTIAAIQMNRETQGVLQQLKEESRQAGNLEASSALVEIMDRHAQNIQPRADAFQQRIMGVTSFWMLLSSPAYYLQNSTQPWMLTLPVLGGKFGFNKASKAMYKNYGVMTRAYKDQHKGFFKSPLRTFAGELASVDKIAEEKGAEYKELIDDLAARGLFDIGIAADLGNFTSGNLIARAHKKFLHAVRSVEVFNRGVTALTALDLAKQDGMSPEEAHAYAVDQVLLTQGDYSGHNAPSIINKLPMGRVITQFRKFQLIQIGLLARMVRQSFAGADKDERAMARRQLMYVLGTHGIAGGALGLPMVQLAGNAAMLAFGDDDEPADFELKMRRMIGDDAMADLILKGLPAFGNVDISSRVGMGQTFSVLPFTDIQFTREGGAEAMAALFGGPTGAVLMNWWDSIGLMQDGNYSTAFAQALPRGFRDAYRAVDYGVNGVRRRNPSRDMAITAEEFGAFDLVMQGIGLPSETITDRQNKSRWLLSTREHLATRSARIKADYIRAKDDGDAQGVLDAKKAWRELQAARVRQGFKRQSFRLLTSAPREQREREGQAVEGVFTRGSERRFMDMLERD